MLHFFSRLSHEQMMHFSFAGKEKGSYCSESGSENFLKINNKPGASPKLVFGCLQ